MNLKYSLEDALKQQRQLPLNTTFADLLMVTMTNSKMYLSHLEPLNFLLIFDHLKYRLTLVRENLLCRTVDKPGSLMSVKLIRLLMMVTETEDSNLSQLNP